MNSIQIENCTINDLKTIIAEVVRAEAKQPDPLPSSDTEYMTRIKTAEFLGLSLPTIWQYTKSGILTGYRIGSRVRYKRDEVEIALKKISTIKYHK